MKRTILLLLIFITTGMYAQHVGVKSNLLYDSTTSMNLGVEFALAPKWTLDVSGNLNPWNFSENRKMKHWMIQPEVRWWTCSRFNGWFLGAHAHFAQFNWGGMLPWGFSNGKMFGSVENQTIMANRFQGWLVGGGIGAGYHWALSTHWGMEFELGVGYAYLNYDRFPCASCGTRISSESKHYIGPTKAAVSLVYLIK